MPDPLARATRVLLLRFRRQRPLRAGSLIVTIFGDAIAPRGEAVTLGSLIGLVAPFGVAERLVRTSVARLAQEDWLVARRDGRRSEYRLSASGRRRFAEATRRIYGEPPPDWRGRWTLVLAPAVDRSERLRLRERLAWLGFGEPMPGVFAHPTRPIVEAREELRGVGLEHAVLLEARSEGADADRRLAERGWDLEELASRYRAFVSAFDPLRAALTGRAAEPASAFVIRTLLVHEYRRIHLRDPLLPASLLPDRWVGATAYGLCREIYARVFAAAERHLGECAESLGGPLPAPRREILERFGGLAGP